MVQRGATVLRRDVRSRLEKDRIVADASIYGIREACVRHRVAAWNVYRWRKRGTGRDPRALTAKQSDVLRAIASLLSATGWPPSLTEIGRVVGVGKSTVRWHLDALEAKGHIRRRRGGLGVDCLVHVRATSATPD